MKTPVAVLLLLTMAFAAGSCGGGGGGVKATTASFNHEILTPAGEPYVARLQIAGIEMATMTQEGTEEITLPTCGIMTARFLTDPAAGAWKTFQDVEVFCNKRNYIWVGYDAGEITLWIGIDKPRLD